ncbi:helix-turn-helix transcriptional regulator [Neobacillus sp. OS1-33]|uniref:helix-turn-helix transcriptional regulator n=1 Tax=Neobacillus sp. OS1-33 TaxID=3070683 RepID=UPI0027E13EF6|nr:helix-turn-helix transcriptional regulator [Neobacillus sp. OS1-33]WML27365.1 helix-turn-helix transcriptional regulator [Neobacillus sp. OS1-33]
MKWFGKDKPRLAKYLARHGLSQKDLEQGSGVSRATINRLCTDSEHQPTIGTAKKILNFLKKFDSSVTFDDFFDM